MALLAGTFGKAAADEFASAGLAVVPDDALMDSEEKLKRDQISGAMDIMMDRLMGGLNYDMKGPGTPTNTIVADARQTGAPKATGPFNAAVAASPQMVQLVTDVTKALDAKPVEKLRADSAPVANADIKQIDQKTADRANTADKAMAAVNTLKSAAQNGGKPSASGLAASSFSTAAAGAVATSLGVPPRIVAAATTVMDMTQAVAANGAGTMSGNIGNSLSQPVNSGERGASVQMASGYNASAAYAPQPNQQQAQAAKPVEIEGLNGRATLAGYALAGIETLKIDGRGLPDLERNISAMTRDARQTRQTMDRIATNGFQMDIGEAAARIGSGGLSARQVDPMVAANASLTVRPLMRPGMGSGFV